jgi:hypothetical protein
LNTTVNTNDAAITQLQNTVSTLDSNITTLNSNVGTLTTAVNGMSTSFSGFATDMSLLRKAAMNRTKIIPATNAFVIFDDDGITAVKEFKLYDNTGSLSSTNIYERRPQ